MRQTQLPAVEGHRLFVLNRPPVSASESLSYVSPLLPTALLPFALS